MGSADSIDVEVVYALPSRQRIFRVCVPTQTKVGEVIRQSGVLDEYPEIDISRARLGIFSRVVTVTAMVENGDRIEIYRPLIADPKTVRRELAKNQRT